MLAAIPRIQIGAVILGVLMVLSSAVQWSGLMA